MQPAVEKSDASSQQASHSSSYPAPSHSPPWAAGWTARRSAAGNTRRWTACRLPATPQSAASHVLTPVHRGEGRVRREVANQRTACKARSSCITGSNCFALCLFRTCICFADTPCLLWHPNICPEHLAPACPPATPSAAGLGRSRSTQCGAARPPPACPGMCSSGLLHSRAEDGGMAVCKGKRALEKASTRMADLQAAAIAQRCKSLCAPGSPVLNARSGTTSPRAFCDGHAKGEGLG